MSTPRLYGCCRGLDRGAYALKTREGYFNFHRPDTGDDDFYFNAYDVDLHWKYLTYLTFNRVRTLTDWDGGPETYPTDADGEWTQTKNRYDGSLGGDTIPPDPPTSSPYSFDWETESTTISSDGKTRTIVYNAPTVTGDPHITQVDTLSDEYSDFSVWSDLNALLLFMNWATLPKGKAALLSYVGPSISFKFRQDFTIDFDWPLGPIDRAFLDLGVFASAMTVKDDVANVYSIRENQFVSPTTDGTLVGWEDDPSGDIACTNYASSNCRLHELEIAAPTIFALPTDTYILKKILQKNQLCS